jgi:hypothetical protein
LGRGKLENVELYVCEEDQENYDAFFERGKCYEIESLEFMLEPGAFDLLSFLNELLDDFCSLSPKRKKLNESMQAEVY